MKESHDVAPRNTKCVALKLKTAVLSNIPQPSAHILGVALKVKALGFGRVSTKKTAPFYVHDDTCTQVGIMCRYGLDHWYVYIRPILIISSVRQRYSGRQYSSTLASLILVVFFHLLVVNPDVTPLYRQTYP